MNPRQRKSRQQNTFRHAHPTPQISTGSIKQISKVVGQLNKAGFVVESVKHRASERPTIRVMCNGKCISMVGRNQAAYYRMGIDPQGRYRMGQFPMGMCRIVWIERGEM